MKVEQRFELPYAPATVWNALQNLESVAQCMPGASLEAPPEDGTVRGQVVVKLGAMSAAFAGEGTVLMDDATMTGVIEGAGVDRRSTSRAKGKATFAVTAADGDRTAVEVEIDYQLSGMLAQFNRGGIVQSVAAQLTARFAENLEALVASQLSADGAEAAIHRAAMRSGAPGENALSLGALVWGALKGFFSRVFQRASAL